MFTVDCDVCGKSMWFYTRTDGFNVCGRCVKVQKKTGTSMADLVAKNLAAVEDAKSSRNFRSNIGCLFLLLVIGAGGYACVQVMIAGGNMLTNLADTAVQVIKLIVPVKVEYRDSMIGRGVVFRIQNVGQGPLVNLGFTTIDSSGSKSGEYVFRKAIQPGETVEVGSLEIGYDLSAKTRFRLTAEGFLPREFNAPEKKPE